MGSGRIKKSAKLLKVDKPEPPGYLDAVSRAEYLGLVAVLEDSGKLSTCDPKLIELYSINYSLLLRAVTDLAGQPLTFSEEGKRPFVNPLIGVVHNSTQKLRQVIGDFALSPVTSKLVEQRITGATVGKWEDLL